MRTQRYRNFRLFRAYRSAIRTPSMRILGCGLVQVNAERAFTLSEGSKLPLCSSGTNGTRRILNGALVPETSYSGMDAGSCLPLQGVEKRKVPFTRLECHATLLLHNRRPNAPDGRAIEDLCPSRVFVSKYLRRKIDKLSFLQPNRQRKRSVRGTWC